MKVFIVTTREGRYDAEDCLEGIFSTYENALEMAKSFEEEGYGVLSDIWIREEEVDYPASGALLWRAVPAHGKGYLWEEQQLF